MQDNIFYNNMLSEVSGINQDFLERQQDDKFNTVVKPLVESLSEMGLVGVGGKLATNAYNVVKNKIFNGVKDVVKQKLKEAGVSDDTIAKFDANTPEEFIANAKNALSDVISQTKQAGTDLYNQAQEQAQNLLEQGQSVQGQLTGTLEQAQTDAGNMLGQAQETTSTLLGQGEQTAQGLLSQGQETAQGLLGQGQEALQSLRGGFNQSFMTGRIPQATTEDEPSILSRIMGRFRSTAPPEEGEASGVDLLPIQKSPFDIGNQLVGDARQQYLDVMSGKPTTADLLSDDLYDTATSQFERLKALNVIQEPDTSFSIPKIAMRPSGQSNTSSNIAKAFRDKQDEITQQQQTEQQEFISNPPEAGEMKTFSMKETPIQEGEPTTAPQEAPPITPEGTTIEQSPLGSIEPTQEDQSIAPTTDTNIEPPIPEATGGEEATGEEIGTNVAKKVGEDVGEDVAETAGVDEIPGIGELSILAGAIAGVVEATRKQRQPIALNPSQQFL